MSKRGRKLIDYDIARHNFDTMAAKRVDQSKLSKVHIGRLFCLGLLLAIIYEYIGQIVGIRLVV